MRRLVIATSDDARAHRSGLIDLLTSTVHRGTPLGFLHPLSPDDAGGYWDGVIASLDRRERVLLLVIDDDRVLGTAQLEFATKQNARHRAEVQKVIVHPSLRGGGLGRTIMDAVEAEALRHGRTLLILDTLEGGVAEPFYARLGWQRTGVIPEYVKDELGVPRATVVFHKILRQEAS